jgi:hypothetical protein
MDRSGWLGRLAVAVTVMFFFLSTAVLAAGLARPGGPSPACCQLIGSGAIGLKNLLLDGSHLVHRSLRRVVHPGAAPAGKAAIDEPHWGRFVAGID